MAALLSGSFAASTFYVNAFGERNLLVEPRISTGTLEILADDGYSLLIPIAVEFERHEQGYTASFIEGNFTATGITKLDALHALEVELLDAFDDWTADESALGPGPRAQLVVLKRHIAKHP